MRQSCVVIAGIVLTAVFSWTDVAGALEGRLSASDIAAFLPTRGEFRFPAPYSTLGVRLSNASDCQGQDCVLPVGYSYWSNINNHAGRDEMLIFLGLDRNKGGGGPTLFSYNKATGETRNRGPLFDGGSPYSWSTGEGWYFSATRPTALYITFGSQLMRYDVESHASELVVDVRTQFGSDKYLWQAHSSSDDRVHSATLRQNGTWEMLGCLVHDEAANQSVYFAKRGAFDECQIDKSGRWLVIKENVDGRNGEDNRVIDWRTGAEQVLLDEQGAAGHSDLGFGYMVAEDNFNNQPGAVRRWDLASDLIGGSAGQGELVYHTSSWGAGLGHVAFGGAREDLSIDRQMACASNASRQDLPRANEIICFPLDGSLNVHVVAPNLTDLDAAGGGTDDYSKLPKGNLDVTGEYFIWTANAGTNRLDAFIVRLPTAGPEAVEPPGTFDKMSPSNGVGDLGASVALSWASSERATAYEYCVDSVDNNQCDAGWMSAGAGLSATASGLTAGQTYYWQVRASNSSGSVLANMDAWWSFTSALVSNPMMSLEAPTANAAFKQSFTVSGWAIDLGAASGSGVDRVDIYAAKSGEPAQYIGTASYGIARSDVGSVYGARFTQSGYALSVGGLSPGTYTLTVEARSVVAGFNQSRSVSIIIHRPGPTSRPAMAVDSPSDDATVSKSFSVSGWAADLGAESGAGVDALHVWAFPKGGGSPAFLGVAAYGGSRSDVGSLLSSQFANTGFSLDATLPTGSYEVVVYMHSTVTGTFNAAVARNVTVVEHATIPAMYMDEPANNSIRPRSQSFTISGWAIDRGATTGSGVTDIHVWAYPSSGGSARFVGVAAYGTSRPDIAAAFGHSRFTNSGFTLTVPGGAFAAGTYTLVAFGNSTVTGTFTQAVVAAVTFTP